MTDKLTKKSLHQILILDSFRPKQLASCSRFTRLTYSFRLNSSSSRLVCSTLNVVRQRRSLADLDTDVVVVESEHVIIADNQLIKASALSLTHFSDVSLALYPLFDVNW